MVSIPLIDVSSLSLHECSNRSIVDTKLRAALEGIGFAYLEGHGISSDKRKAVRELSIDFFALPDSIKNNYALNKWHRGYLGPKASTIVTSSVAEVTTPNQSESFLALTEYNLSEINLENTNPLAGPNQWPSELPELELVCKDYMQNMRDFSMKILHSIARGLELEENWFDTYFNHPTEFLRLLRYWPQNVEDDVYGSAPHTDYGFLTFVAQDDVGGLEVRGRDGIWIPIPPIEETFVLNVADILSIWTGGLFVSTPHRVKNTSDRERFSQPYFFDPSMDTVVSPIPGLNAGSNFQSVTYGKYLMERLDKNYDYRQ